MLSPGSDAFLSVPNPWDEQIPLVHDETSFSAGKPCVVTFAEPLEIIMKVPSATLSSVNDYQCIVQPEAGSRYKCDAEIMRVMGKSNREPYWPLQELTLLALAHCASRYVDITKTLDRWPPDPNGEPEMLSASIVHYISMCTSTENEVIKRAQSITGVGRLLKSKLIWDSIDQEREQLYETMLSLLLKRTPRRRYCPLPTLAAEIPAGHSILLINRLANELDRRAHKLYQETQVLDVLEPPARDVLLMVESMIAYLSNLKTF